VLELVVASLAVSAALGSVVLIITLRIADHFSLCQPNRGFDPLGELKN
jgi:hypothetical protein